MVFQSRPQTHVHGKLNLESMGGWPLLKGLGCRYAARSTVCQKVMVLPRPAMTLSFLKILAIASAVLIGCIFLELIGWQNRGLPEEAVSISLPNQRPLESRSPPASLQPWVTVILARPLFSVGRRPKTATSVADAKGAALPRLAGVVVSSSGRNAIFASPPGDKPITAAEGSRIGAFLVQFIEAGRVVVIGPDGPLTVHPVFDSAKAPDKPVVAPNPMANHRDMQELFQKGVASLPSHPGLPTLGKN
jgi:hypothetical protein